MKVVMSFDVKDSEANTIDIQRLVQSLKDNIITSLISEKDNVIRDSKIMKQDIDVIRLVSLYDHSIETLEIKCWGKN